jgi:hypothetical protein
MSVFQQTIQFAACSVANKVLRDWMLAGTGKRPIPCPAESEDKSISHGATSMSRDADDWPQGSATLQGRS